jgi:hypothetical protein
MARDGELGVSAVVRNMGFGVSALSMKRDVRHCFCPLDGISVDKK